MAAVGGRGGESVGGCTGEGGCDLPAMVGRVIESVAECRGEGDLDLLAVASGVGQFAIEALRRQPREPWAPARHRLAEFLADLGAIGMKFRVERHARRLPFGEA